LAEEYQAPLTPPYQGGEQTAASSLLKKERVERGLFPRVFLERSEFGFSFSGLKSAVKREVDVRTGTGTFSVPVPLNEEDKQEISYEFQSAVNEVLCYKLINAAKEKRVKTIMLA